MTSRNPQSLRRSQLTSAILATLLIPGMAFAQDTSSTAEDDKKEEQASSQPQPSRNLDRIQVIGSRIKRAEVEGPSPVTVISTDQLEREGFVTVSDALKTLTQNAGSSQNELNSAGGFTPNASPINLRGLGEGRTLLLISRQHRSEEEL